MTKVVVFEKEDRVGVPGLRRLDVATSSLAIAEFVVDRIADTF